MKKVLLLMSVAVLAVGCRNSGRVGFWEDYTDVFDADGRVESYEIRKGCPFVVTMADYDCLADILRHTPRGKIDSIIASNPDWEFVFYGKGFESKDSLKVMDLLSRYGCRFPVIFDPQGMWERKYMRDSYAAIGLIFDASGQRIDLGIIGTSQSMFDGAFASAKRQLGMTDRVVYE